MVDEALAHKLYPLGNLFSDIMLEMGYLHLQPTKPNTVGKLNIYIFYFLKKTIFKIIVNI